MARTSLTAAMFRLAELRDLRQKLVVTRLRLVAGTDRDGGSGSPRSRLTGWR